MSMGCISLKVIDLCGLYLNEETVCVKYLAMRSTRLPTHKAMLNLVDLEIFGDR